MTSFKDLPNNSGPRYVTAGQGDTLWVGLENADKVAKITGVWASSAGRQPAARSTAIASSRPSIVAVEPSPPS